MRLFPSMSSLLTRSQIRRTTTIDKWRPRSNHATDRAPRAPPRDSAQHPLLNPVLHASERLPQLHLQRRHGPASIRRDASRAIADHGAPGTHRSGWIRSPQGRRPQGKDRDNVHRQVRGGRVRIVISCFVPILTPVLIQSGNRRRWSFQGVFHFAV